MPDPQDHDLRLGDPAQPAADGERPDGATPVANLEPPASADPAADRERPDGAARVAGLEPPASAEPAADGERADGTNAAPFAETAHSDSADLRRQRAFDVAWRHLAQRDRTEAELRANFERKGVEPALAEEVLGELREGAYVDDAGYARRFAEDRRNLDAWGSERIERRLLQLGVDRDHIRAALAAGADGDHDELGAARELLARRFPIPPDTPKDRERALGFLVRKGYALDLAYDALRRHAGAAVDG